MTKVTTNGLGWIKLVSVIRSEEHGRDNGPDREELSTIERYIRQWQIKYTRVDQLGVISYFLLG